MGGRVAEEIISTPNLRCFVRLLSKQQLARAMVTEYGMSENLTSPIWGCTMRWIQDYLYDR